MSSGTNFAYIPPVSTAPLSINLPTISVTAGPPDPIGGGGALPGDGSYGDPIAGFHQINQQFADNQRAFSERMDAQSAAFNAALTEQAAARSAQMQSQTDANLASMNAQRAAMSAPPITGPILPPSFLRAAQAALPPVAPGLLAFDQAPPPAIPAEAPPQAPDPALAAAGLAAAPGATFGEGLLAGAEVIGAALPSAARILPAATGVGAFLYGLFGNTGTIPSDAAETQMRLESEARMQALGLRPGQTVPDAAPPEGGTAPEAPADAVPTLPGAFGPVPAFAGLDPALFAAGGPALGFAPLPDGAFAPLPGFAPAVPNLGPEGFTPALPGFGALPGFAAAPPQGLALPGLTPAQPMPPLPGFGPVDPAMTGVVTLEARSLGDLRGDLTDTIGLRARQLELGDDPALGGYRQAEGIAGVRLEQALGRRIDRSADPAYDFVDRILGPISLKGPLPERGSLEGLRNSVIRDAMGGNTATRVLVVDTLGLSDQQFETLRNDVANGTQGTQKTIIFLR